MREKAYEVLKKIYGITMTIAFFGGLLPLFPFIIALIIGGGEGGTGEAIGSWLYKEYYPWVIALASIAVLIGLIAMYVGKQEAFSTKSFGMDKKKEAPADAAEEAKEVAEAVEEETEVAEEIKEELKREKEEE